jgi:hypothetical protein
MRSKITLKQFVISLAVIISIAILFAVIVHKLN